MEAWHNSNYFNRAPALLVSPPVSKFQVGGFNSPASQPRAPDVMGSLDMTVV
jgi:hypothetical protein